MIRFNNDYNHGAFASILKELGATNSTSYAAAGDEPFTTLLGTGGACASRL